MKQHIPAILIGALVVTLLWGHVWTLGMLGVGGIGGWYGHKVKSRWLSKK